MNELENESLKEMQKLIPGSHHIDLVIRGGGKDYWIEADFLKPIIMKLTKSFF